MSIRRSTGENIGHAIIVVILTLFAISTFYPLWHVFMYSISDSKSAIGGGAFLWPKGISFTQFEIMFRTGNMLNSFKNSVLRVVIGVPFNILMTASLAFPLAHKKLVGREGFSMYVFFTMLFSGGMIPSFLVIKSIGLYDSPFVYILPTAISAYNMFVMKSYFQQLPAELEESAQLDGAGPTLTLVKIILPVSLPVIAALAMFYGVGHWNSYLDGIIYIESRKYQLFQLFLRSMIVDNSTQTLAGIDNISDIASVTEESLKMATITLSIIPVLVCYPFIQRYYIKGLTIGAVKG